MCRLPPEFAESLVTGTRRIVSRSNGSWLAVILEEEDEGTFAELLSIAADFRRRQ